MSTIPRLHDATLQRFVLLWEAGVVRLELSTGINGTDVVIIEASGVLHALCPRLFPWGPSDSVNEVRSERTPNGMLVSIEMQSGDVLEIACKEVLVKQLLE